MRQFGTSHRDEAKSVSVDAAGAAYVAGSVGPDLALPGQTSAGESDAFVRKYDSAGTELWTRQFGSSGWDVAGSVSVGADGAIYVAGNVSEALPGHSPEAST